MSSCGGSPLDGAPRSLNSFGYGLPWREALTAPYRFCPPLGGSDSALLEDAPRDAHGRGRRWPAGIEGEVRDQFHQLVAGDAVGEGQLEVGAELVGPVEG